MRPKVLALSCGFAVGLWTGLTVSAAASEVSIEPVADALSSEVPALQEETAPETSAAFPEDIPEEILRTEIITAARSPLTGEPLSAAEYAQLQATLAAPAGNALVSPDLRHLIFLLQLRRSVRPILPFIP